MLYRTEKKHWSKTNDIKTNICLYLGLAVELTLCRLQAERDSSSVFLFFPSCADVSKSGYTDSNFILLKPWDKKS